MVDLVNTKQAITPKAKTLLLILLLVRTQYLRPMELPSGEKIHGQSQHNQTLVETAPRTKTHLDYVGRRTPPQNPYTLLQEHHGLVCSSNGADRQKTLHRKTHRLHPKNEGTNPSAAFFLASHKWLKNEPQYVMGYKITPENKETLLRKVDILTAQSPLWLCGSYGELQPLCHEHENEKKIKK